MIRSYVLEGEQYKLVHRSGSIDFVPFREDIERIVTLQNQIEYLEQELEEDEVFLDIYKNREKHVKTSLLKSTFAGACATASMAIIAYKFTGNLEPTFISGASCGGVIFSSILFNYLKGSYRKEIASYTEVVQYVLETLDEKNNELNALLLENSFHSNNLIMVDSEEKSVDIGACLKPIRDGVSLRYQYGRNKRKFLKHLKNLSLFLKIYGYSSVAVEEFMPYIEEEYRKRQENGPIKRLQKLVTQERFN